MMKTLRILLLPALLAGALQAFGTTPVWSTDVAPILYNHCTVCHHGGGIAPFALMSFSDTRLQDTAVKNAVVARTMPPWPPNTAYSRFAHERVLSTTEINTIVNWVNGGSVAGDTTLAPPAPVYSSTAALPGTPDLVVRIPTYTSTASTGDMYQCFAMPSGLLTEKYIRAMEVIAGNSQMVHHVAVFADTSGICAHLDSLAAGPGYPGFGGVGTNTAKMIGSWVPGASPMVYPSGFGVKLFRNSTIALQIHYPAGTVGLSDSTEVHFFFTTGSTPRELYMEAGLNHWTNIDSPLFIPANTVRSFTEQITTPTDYSILGLNPHMHLLGKSINVYAVRPTGDTDKLIDIPEWDFHWQGHYLFPRFRKLVSGSVLRSDATFDNTTANPENPSGPPVDVYGGESTTDEMMVTYFIFTTYQPGDEDIIVDSSIALSAETPYYRGQQLLDVYPNPSVTDVVVKCYFSEDETAAIDIIDLNGRLAKRLATATPVSKGYHALTYQVSDLPAGQYVLRMQTSERVLCKKIVVGPR